MKVLVAEDDDVIRRLLELLLGQWGHETVLTSDGVSAAAAYAEEPFDAVITDWMMPGMDGLELVARIRGIRAREYPWVIMLTSKVFRDNYAKAMSSGVDDFLSKPLDRELLRVRLEVAARVLRMRGQILAMSAILPMCMYCKSVRDPRDILQRWEKVETFIRENTDHDVSHGYCPVCHYQHVLLPDVRKLRMRRGRAARPLSPQSGIDVAAFSALLDFDRAEAPGFAEDLIDSFRVCARTEAEKDLRSLSEGDGGSETLSRLRGFAERAEDVGAFALSSVLRSAIETRSPRSAHAALAELGLVLDDLPPSGGSENAPGSPGAHERR